MGFFLFLIIFVAIIIIIKKNKSSKSNIKSSNNYNDLVTFRISSSYNDIEESKNKTPGIWIPPNSSVQVKNFTISGGYIYFGGVLKDAYGYNTEASLVDKTLKITESFENYEDQSLGYWPTYLGISPKCRWAYLKWLSSDRNDPNTPIGYVFIYFYGLERRVIDDLAGQSHSNAKELEVLRKEISRLHEAYTENRSFKRYSSNLVDYIRFLLPNTQHYNSIETETYPSSIQFKLKLANTVNDGSPISPYLAYTWMQSYEDYYPKTPARRCAEDFKELFFIYYSEKYGDGLLVKPNKRKLRIEYHPASSTLRGLGDISLDLPDPTYLSVPVKKIIKIAERCIDELDQYSRYLGRKGSSKDHLQARFLLPPVLLTKRNPDIIKNLKSLFENSLKNGKGIVKLSELWKTCGQDEPISYTKKDIELLTKVIESTGDGYAPDIRYHNEKPLPDGYVALVKNGHSKHFNPSPHFYKIAIKIRLGAMVAISDFNIHDKEVIFLDNLIVHDTELSPIEKNSLNAYLNWCLKSNLPITGLKKKLSSLNVTEKKIISHLLLNTALADGSIHPEEIKQIEKLYDTLGLDKSLVTSDIHNASVGKAGNLRTATDSGFELDKNAIEQHSQNTKDVQNLLGNIFIDDSELQMADSTPLVKQSANVLAKDNLILFSKLKDKESWDIKEIQDFCDSNDILMSGAIEAINDWAYEIVDSSVIDVDDRVYVDNEIVDEIKKI